MLLFIQTLAKPPVTPFTASGFANEYEFVALDLSPRFLDSAFMGNECGTWSAVAADLNQDMSARFLDCATMCDAYVNVTADCSNLYQ